MALLSTIRPLRTIGVAVPASETSEVEDLDARVALRGGVSSTTREIRTGRAREASADEVRGAGRTDGL